MSGDRPARRRASSSPQGVGVGILGSVVPGAGRHRPGGAGLRPRSGHRLPGPRRAVRELVDSVRGALRRAVRGARRAARRLASRVAERHLLPGRPDHGRGARGQERHPDRGVRQRDPHAWHASPRGRGRSGARAVPADSHDVVRLHPRRVAAGDRAAAPAPAAATRSAPACSPECCSPPRSASSSSRSSSGSSAGLAEGRRAAPAGGRRRAAALTGLAGGSMIRHSALAPVGLCRGRMRRRAELSPGGSRSRLDPGRGGAVERERQRVLRLARRGPGRTTPWRPAGAPLSAARAARPTRSPASRGSTSSATRRWSGWSGRRCSQNRDLQTAVGRIREFRAEVGIARAPLFPELTANGSVSTNQVAIGSFPPTSYDAFRVTGDVAWELDFWGRTRRGIEAARGRPRLARRRRSARWCCRS